MPEYEGRAPAFYDHETEEPRTTGRRRRQVADWGVGEDVFDRLPSRRFERRGEERRHAARHEDFRREEHADDWAEERGASERFARRDYPQQRIVEDEPRAAAPPRDRDEPVAPRRRREPPADWLEETAPREEPEELAEDAVARADTDGRRTIVIGGAVEREIPPPESQSEAETNVALAAPRERRTIVIGGHPDGLPIIRQRRPSRTAAERVGARPDRFVAYAVAMGFLLILIAILTTGH
jgi:hypothetical protein